jgi:hypothetical protein
MTHKAIKPSEEIQLKMQELSNRLRKIAAPVGPLHSYWDLIFDMESFIDGKETLLNQTADEWIKMAEETLK